MHDSTSITEAARAVAEQLTEWRKEHHAPTPIPDSIWSGAVSLASQYGIGPVSRALKLDYAGLKRRAAGLEAVRKGSKGQAQPSTFLEWLTPASAPPVGECILELEVRKGKLRLEMRNVPAAGLCELVRELAG